MSDSRAENTTDLASNDRSYDMMSASLNIGSDVSTVSLPSAEGGSSITRRPPALYDV